MVGFEEDEEGGLVVTVEELHVDDVEELLVQLPHVDDVAGQEAGLLPATGEEEEEEEGSGETPKCPWVGGGMEKVGGSPLPHQALVLVGEGVAAKGRTTRRVP